MHICAILRKLSKTRIPTSISGEAQKIIDKNAKNMKIDKNLPRSSLTVMDVLYFIVLHIDGSVNKKFQPSIFYRSRENQIFSKTF